MKQKADESKKKEERKQTNKKTREKKKNQTKTEDTEKKAKEAIGKVDLAATIAYHERRDADAGVSIAPSLKHSDCAV